MLTALPKGERPGPPMLSFERCTNPTEARAARAAAAGVRVQGELGLVKVRACVRLWLRGVRGGVVGEWGMKEVRGTWLRRPSERLGGKGLTDIPCNPSSSA